MPSTATQIISFVQQDRYDWISQSSGLAYINQINKELLLRIPKLRKHSDPTPQEINIVAGTNEYDVNTGGTIANEIMTQIAYVEMNYNATGYSKLSPTNIEELDRGIEDEATNKTWREQTGQPTSYYIDARGSGLYIGFNLQPAQNGVIRIWGSAQKDLALGDNVLFLLSEELYYEGICYRHCKAKGLFNEAFMYLQAFEHEVNMAKAWVNSMTEAYQGDMQNARG